MSSKQESVLDLIATRVFKDLPEQTRHEIVHELQQRRIVLLESTSDFTKRTNEKVQSKRSADIRRALGSPVWRQSKDLDDFKTMDISLETMQQIHLCWTKYVENVFKESKTGGGVSLRILEKVDIRGAKIEITCCKDPRLVGIIGIVFGINDDEIWIIDNANNKWKFHKSGSAFLIIMKNGSLRATESLLFQEKLKRHKAKRQRKNRYFCQPRKFSSKETPCTKMDG